MHVLARLDGGRRDADRDPVFRDWRTGPDRQQGNLVPKRDVVGGSGPCTLELSSSTTPSTVSPAPIGSAATPTLSPSA